MTHLGVDVATPAWRSDGQMLAFAANTHQRDEHAYERSDLWTVTLDGESKRVTAEDGWNHRSPAWSPDGHFIAVLRDEGLDRILQSKRQQGSALDLYLVPVSGGTPRNLTPDWDDIPGPPKWSGDGKSIFFHAAVKGKSKFSRPQDTLSCSRTRAGLPGMAKSFNKISGAHGVTVIWKTSCPASITL